MIINLYSTGCPKCNVLEKKLNTANIDFKIITDMDKIEKICEATGNDMLPLLEIEEGGETRIYGFSEAIKWVGEYNA